MQIIELVDDDEITWRYHPEDDTYQPGESVPMGSLIFKHVYPEVYAVFNRS